jgi:hypothetical protein
VGNILRERPAKESRRADSNRFPAHYEFASRRTSASYCVRELRLFRRFVKIWGIALSSTYQPVPARLQYGCSRFADWMDPDIRDYLPG